jgi:nucleoside-diphosphate kinase
MIERTLVVIKPDGVKRGLVGEIIRRIERTGLKIVAMKMVWADKNFAKKHYFDVEERHGKTVFESLVGYLTEGPVVAICFEGIKAISLVRKIVGATYPDEALPGTIRGDFCHISKDYANKNKRRVGNLVHASAKEADAKTELALWFSVNELHDYKISHQDEVY